MATLTIAEGRVEELQDVLLVVLAASKRIERVRGELDGLEKVLNEAGEAIYNATVYDPMGEAEAVTA